jgi:hypothetical protein
VLAAGDGTPRLRFTMPFVETRFKQLAEVTS